MFSFLSLNKSFKTLTLNPQSLVTVDVKGVEVDLSNQAVSVLGSSRMEEDGDKLILRGLKFQGYHGVLPEEKTLDQKFVIDMDAWVDLREPGKTDNLNDSISYVYLYNIVKEVVEGAGHDLLESVSRLIATKTLKTFPRISTVRVKLMKPHVSVPGPVDYLGIESFRSRKVDV